MKLRLGMIGGGQGAFIGAVHRIAARIDGEYELVCGAFSSNAEKSQASGLLLDIPANRVYNSYTELIEKEKQLPDQITYTLIRQKWRWRMASMLFWINP